MGGDFYSLSEMEVSPSFLLLILTWTAQKTFCKSTNWNGRMNVINTTENQIPPAGIRNMVGGDEEKGSFDSQHVKPTDGGREVEMVDNNRRLPLTGPGGPGGSGGPAGSGGPGGPDGREEAERMTLTKIDDMWLTEDQLPMK